MMNTEKLTVQVVATGYLHCTCTTCTVLLALYLHCYLHYTCTVATTASYYLYEILAHKKTASHTGRSCTCFPLGVNCSR